MNQRLDQLRWSLVDLADRMGESYRNVHRWVREDVRIPGHFLSRFVETVPVDAQWLLTGSGSPDPVGAAEAERALDEIAHVLDSVRAAGPDNAFAAAVVDGVPLPLYAVNRHGLVTLWNSAMTGLTGLSSADVVGKPLDRYLAVSAPPPAGGAGSAMRKGSFRRTASAGKQGLAPVDLVDIEVSPVRERGGRVVGTMGIVFDTSVTRGLGSTRGSEVRSASG